METIPQEQEPLLETCKQLMLLGDIADAYTYQTFPDGKPSSTPPTILHGRIDNCWDELEALNAKGHGIFLMINGGDGRGRATENVTTLRALFIDEDLKDGVISKPFHVPPSMIIKSGGGRHIYWRLKPGESLEKFKAAQQRLAAYYSTDPKVCDLPRVLRLAGFKHQKAEPVMVTVLESNTDTAYTIDELMAGIPELTTPVESKAIPASQVAASHKVYDVVPMQYRIDAALEYLNTAEPAVSGSGGHNALMAVAGALINGFLLDYSTALDLILEHYNPNCLPPFSTRDVEHKLTDACTKGPRHSPENYLTSALERVYRDSTRERDEAKGTTFDRTRPHVMDVDDFIALELPPCEYLFKGLIIRSGLCIVSAPPKAGKSTTVRAMIRQLLHGEAFLNYPVSLQNPIVTLIDYETQPESALKELLKQMNPPKGTLRVVRNAVTINGKDPVQHLEELLFTGEGRKLPNPNVVVIDTLGRFFPAIKDGNDYHEVNRILSALKDLASKYECAIIGVHHAGKDFSGSPSTHENAMQRILGSTAFRSVPDCNIVLFRDHAAGSIEIFGEQRFSQDSPIFHIKSSYNTATGTFTEMLDSGFSRKEELINQILFEAHEPLSASAVDEKMPKGFGKILPTLEDLTQRGLVYTGYYYSTKAKRQVTAFTVDRYKHMLGATTLDAINALKDSTSSLATSDEARTDWNDSLNS